MVALIEDDRAYPVLDQPVHELTGIGVQDPLEPGGVFPHQIPPDGPRPAPDSSPVGPAVPVGQFLDPPPGVRLGAAAGNEFGHPLFIGEISERILVGDHAEHLIGQRSEVTQLLRFFTDGRAGGVRAGGGGAGGAGAGGGGAGGGRAGGAGAAGAGGGGGGRGWGWRRWGWRRRGWRRRGWRRRGWRRRGWRRRGWRRRGWRRWGWRRRGWRRWGWRRRGWRRRRRAPRPYRPIGAGSWPS